MIIRPTMNNIRFYNIKFYNIRFYNIRLYNIKFYNIRFYNIRFYNIRFTILGFTILGFMILGFTILGLTNILYLIFEEKLRKHNLKLLTPMGGMYLRWCQKLGVKQCFTQYCVKYIFMNSDVIHLGVVQLYEEPVALNQY